MIPPQAPRGLPSQVLANRPDIAQSEQDLIAANVQIGAAEALYCPRISLIGSGGGVSAELANLFSGPAGVWSFAGAVTGPIFNAGAISGQVDQARALREQMLNQYRLNIQNAFREVQDALVAFHKSRAQRAHFVRSVAALRAPRYSHLRNIATASPIIRRSSSPSRTFTRHGSWPCRRNRPCFSTPSPSINPWAAGGSGPGPPSRSYLRTHKQCPLDVP